MSTKFSYTNQTVSGIEYKDGQWKVGSNTLKTKDGPFWTSINPTAELSLNGTLFGGISTEAKIKLFNNDNIKISIEPEIGLYGNAELSLALTDPTIYESLKDSKINAGLKIGVTASADAGIFKKDEAKWSCPLFEQDFEFISSYLFPAFDQENVEVDNKAKTATANYNVSRNLMFDSSIGISLFKEGEKVKDSTPEKYVFEDDYENPLQATFSNLIEDIPYTVNPYVKWGEWIIQASPEQSFTITKEDEGEEEGDPENTLVVVTGNAINTTTTSTTLSGSISGMETDKTYQYGFIYTTTGTPTVENGTIVNVTSMQENGSFSTTINSLTENTTYSWCAYACDENKNYTYGSIKTFVTTSTEQKSERDILVAFYNATGGDNWTNNTNWCTDAPLDDWYGVRLDEENKVHTINLNHNNIIGSVDLSGLEHLCDLRLEGRLNTVNYASNKIISINLSGCINLKYLYLKENQELRQLTLGNETNRLIRLDLSNTSIEDYSFLSNLHSLEELYINNCLINQLDVSSLTSLKHLQCCNNRLSELNVSNLSNLQSLQCTNNKLTSIDISSLKNLTILCCESNQISNLKLCTSLEHLYCEDNKLTGLLDLSQLDKLQVLYCYYNQLTSIDVRNSNELSAINPLAVNTPSHAHDPNSEKNDYVQTVYLSTHTAEILNSKYGGRIIVFRYWGESDLEKYPSPHYIGGYRYPHFIFEE